MMLMCHRASDFMIGFEIGAQVQFSAQPVKYLLFLSGCLLWSCDLVLISPQAN